jgi:hypothetical protein
VYYERLGDVDPQSVYKHVTKEEILHFHAYKQEQSLQDITNLAVEQKRPFKGRVAVMDLSGLGWKHMHKDGMILSYPIAFRIFMCLFFVGLSVLKLAIKMDESNFPECLKRLFIIKAPAVFTGFLQSFFLY